jgi:hypothetical protein
MIERAAASSNGRASNATLERYFCAQLPCLMMFLSHPMSCAIGMMPVMIAMTRIGSRDRLLASLQLISPSYLRAP